jgi:hypothetical protein
MKPYTLSEINFIKQEIRTGKPISIIADDLAKEWSRPIGGVYTKVWKLSKLTRKIKGGYTGPNRRPTVKKLRPKIASRIPYIWDINENEEIILKEICEEIVNKEEEPIIEQQPADIGIEVPVSSMSFTGTPSRVVIYPDHVRYYYNN